MVNYLNFNILISEIRNSYFVFVFPFYTFIFPFLFVWFVVGILFRLSVSLSIFKKITFIRKTKLKRKFNISLKNINQYEIIFNAKTTSLLE